MFIMVTGVNASGDFEQVLDLYENKEFYRFERSTSSFKGEEWQNLYLSALLYGLKGKFKHSNTAIDSLLTSGRTLLADSLEKTLLEIKITNSVNLCDYKTAAKTSELLLKDFSGIMEKKEKDDVVNSLKIWDAASLLPVETATIEKDVKIPAERDLAGLLNVPVKINGITEDFVFDTGANFSVITKTYARKMKVKMLKGNIEVGAITGKKVISELAYAELLMIGGIEFHNVLFLVLPDDALSFAGGMYVINGIIGLPVIKAMKELHIRDNEIFVPSVPVAKDLNNLLIDGFISVIEVVIGNDSLAFTFDTGAKTTHMNRSYYLAHKEEIEKKYEPEEIELGGAGGTVKIKGFRIDEINFSVGSSGAQIKDIRLLAENIKDKEDLYYGNLGQDYMSQFSEMILNFESMYIDFRK